MLNKTAEVKQNCAVDDNFGLPDNSVLENVIIIVSDSFLLSKNL